MNWEASLPGGTKIEPRSVSGAPSPKSPKELARSPGGKERRGSSSTDRTKLGAIKWADARFVYEASGRQVSEVLRDFGAAQKLPIVTSEGVEGVVRGRFDNTPTEFLEALSRSYGLIWYHDGAALYVYPANAIRSRVFRLQGFDSRRIDALMAMLTWGDARYPLKYSASEKTLLVTGPPRHIELVSQLVEVLDAESSERLRPVIEVVPLKFASAATGGVNGVAQPGLADTMQRLFDDSAVPRAVTPGLNAPNSLHEAPEAKLAASSTAPRVLDMLAGKSRRSDVVSSIAAESSRGLQSPLSGPDRPKFIADAYSNSVIITGNPLRMAHYVETLKKLDIEPLQIELEALILDVSSEQTESLGLSWSVSAGSAKSVPESSWSAGASSPSLNVQASWANAGIAIQARLLAMTQDGRAKLVSRPKVIATVNMPATLSSQRRASVKVAGNLEAKLYSIDSGTSIQVTPQAYLIDGSYRIRLTLAIEDGDFETRTVDGVPVMRRMQVTTDVRMTEGDSVVLGGISADGSQNNRIGIPWLSDLPFLGPLFRTSESVQTRTERLFMITPRVIHPTRPAKPLGANSDPVRD